jgi:sec-independent protein translocase protein TatC
MTAGSPAPKDRPQSILSHLEELRWRIVKVALAVVGASVVALLVANPVKDLLERPYERVCDDCRFQVLAATEQFSVLMRIALFGGILLASPVVLYQVWAFINPALTRRERRWAVPIIAACVVLFVGGVGFGYWTLPRGLGFLLGIFSDVRTDLRMGDYFSFVIRFLLAFGVSFLYPVFLFAVAAAGAVSSAQLGRGRRWAVLVIVVAAAAITPTGDALTLALLSVPLYVLYELTYWLVRLVLRK